MKYPEYNCRQVLEKIFKDHKFPKSIFLKDHQLTCYNDELKIGL